MEPILHLSLPVADLAEAREFYVTTLGCRPGRVRDGWADVWFHGLQLTLQERPDAVRPVEEVRHLGVTLDRATFHELLARLTGDAVRWLRGPSEPAHDPDGKVAVTLLDPSGNVIELKTYESGAPPGWVAETA